MNHTHISGLVWSVGAAIVLMFCLGLSLVALMLVGQGGDAIEDGAGQASGSSGEAVACFFTADAERLAVYQAPIIAQSQQQATVLGREQYRVVRQNGDFYEINVADGTGWVVKDAGSLTGDDCDRVPKDDTALTDFSTVCMYTSDSEITLFTEADLVNAVRTLDPGSYLVQSVNTDLNRYYIVLSDGFSGWTSGEGTLAGAGCAALTATPTTPQ